MKAEYVITEEAYTSLDKILKHITQDNPLASVEFETNILDAYEFLLANPYAGRTREEFTDKPLRFWVAHKNYIIVYSIEEPNIVIHDILHVARDIPGLL